MAEPAEPPPDMSDEEEDWLTDEKTLDLPLVITGQQSRVMLVARVEKKHSAMAMKKKTMKVVVKKWNIVATATILKKSLRLS